ncbi:oligosaccharide flippase family protein [Parabacteroides johnsonii]|uniref:oligosaccharide flippase family protein n=1 Tax=Parabacteroides johnsonii TaxID=387661 RepID=UPI0011DC999A|nr:oligosaccharide flippase family protein [Parabacteroides johnsonii]MCS3050334.1 oligosaccharide flippase family protein [Parabacteroides johnsonii]
MKDNSNTAQALWVALGSLASFGFSIVSSMILSRYFDKVDYGTYKQVMYVYNTLLFVFTLGLPKAYGYFLPRVKLEEGHSLVFKITMLFFIMGTFFSLILFTGASTIADILNNPDLTTALRIFAIVPFFMLPTMGIEAIYSTYRKTYINSIYVVCSRTFMILCVVFPVIVLRGTSMHAILGFVVASSLDFLLAMYLKKRPFKGIEKNKTKVTYKEIFRFSLPLMMASFWGMIIKSADQFFISRYFGEEVFADFSNGFMELPFIGMIVGACSTVLFPLFSKIDHEGLDPKDVIYPIWMSVFKKTAMLIYPLLIVSWFFAEDIMTILYGQKYITSFAYFRIIQIANLFTLVSYAPVILAIGKTKYYANVHMWSAIALVIVEFLAVKFIPSAIAIAFISVTCHIGRIFAMLVMVCKYFRVSFFQLFPIKTMGLILIPSIIFMMIYNICTDISNPLVNLLAGGTSYAIIYLIYSCFVGLDYRILIKPLIVRK